jgi:serine/threonine-protein kinase HipA
MAAMSVGGEYRFESMAETGFAHEATRLGVEPDRAVEELRRLRHDVLDAFALVRDSLIAHDEDTAGFARAAVDRLSAIPTLGDPR